MFPKGTRIFGAALTLTAAVGLAACGGKSATSTDSKSFPLSGKTLRIDASEAAVRVENGKSDVVEVRRELKGKATEKGNATWSMSGDTLKLGLNCSGIVVDCEGRYVVAVPAGTAIRVDGSGSAVTLDAVAGDVDATVSDDGTLRLTGPSGKLNLVSRGGSVTVIGARSTDVSARTSGDGNISLGFAVAPTRVEAKGSGAVQVTVPNDTQTYRIVGADSGSLASDDASSRSITVAADGTARVQRAG